MSENWALRYLYVSECNYPISHMEHLIWYQRSSEDAFIISCSSTKNTYDGAKICEHWTIGWEGGRACQDIIGACPDTNQTIPGTYNPSLVYSVSWYQRIYCTLQEAQAPKLLQGRYFCGNCSCYLPKPHPPSKINVYSQALSVPVLPDPDKSSSAI
jgi:hypothetical protein